MYTFWLVIVDLFWFSLGKDTPEPVVLLGVREEIKTLPPRPNPLPEYLLASPPEKEEMISRIPQKREHSVPTNILAQTPISMSPLHAPVVMYVNNLVGAALYTAPQQEYDGIVELVPYGTAVSVVGYQGRYASVLRSLVTGWIVKDNLVSEKNTVWPQFVVRQEYLSPAADTIKLRALLLDNFGAGILNLPLQAGEYVSFRLLQDHRTILWPALRPRMPGTWQTMLRGVSGIHATITPKTDSIMEWRNEENEGRLAYIESVSPDNTISLSLVGLREAGLYETLTLSEEKWRELRPVFIEVT